MKTLNFGKSTYQMRLVIDASSCLPESHLSFSAQSRFSDDILYKRRKVDYYVVYFF